MYPPEPTSGAAVGASRAVVHACARFTSPSAACTTSRRVHKDSTASLPQSQPPLHAVRGYSTVCHFRQRKQLWNCSQLHLPFRRVIRLSGRGWRELHDWAAEQQQPLRFVALHRAQQCRPAELCSGRRLASRRECCARLRYPRGACTPASAKWGMCGAPLQSVPRTQSRTLCLPPGELAKLCQAGL